ncbi:MAG: YgfZ/GcvT domain-containing protein [Steroidobacteraceae bacterium]
MARLDIGFHELPALGTILVSGAGARTFLQGQLSTDLASLTAQRALLASCNSAQGRVQAIMWVVERREGIALVLPAAMVETIAMRLRKYVLRSKVTIDPATARLRVAAIEPTALPAGVSLGESGTSHEHDGTSYIRLPGHELILALTAESADVDPARELQWQLEGIRAGLPQVYPATHEAFVAQMLNLDLVGGISFEKGCYTGQEIIARTHFRGAIKRRMLHFAAACPPPAPATRIVSGESHAGDVVDAAPTPEGCELLAVVSLAQANDELRLSDGVKLARLELPYQVVDAPLTQPPTANRPL